MHKTNFNINFLEFIPEPKRIAIKQNNARVISLSIKLVYENLVEKEIILILHISFKWHAKEPDPLCRLQIQRYIVVGE